MSTKWRVRPSQFLAIENDVAAFYFDKAVYSFGVTFDADIEEHSKSRGKKPDTEEQTKRKREQRMARWLADGSTPASAQPRRFRDPAAEM
jgi:hypothetical protein